MSMLLVLPPELWDKISSDLQGPADVLHFGVTCKTIWNVAEVQLWRESSSYALCCLFPLDLFPSFSRRSRGHTAASLRPLTPEELKPLLHYGAFIQHLELRDKSAVSDVTDGDRLGFHHSKLSSCGLARTMEAALTILNPSSAHPLPFLPSLRSLKLVVYDSNNVARVAPLLDRPLVSLGITLCSRKSIYPAGIMLKILDTIRPCSELEKLELRMDRPNQDEAVDSTMASLLLQLPNLRDFLLQGTMTGTRYLDALAGCPRLHTLQILQIWTGITAPLDAPVLGQGSFPSLHSFAFSLCPPGMKGSPGYEVYPASLLASFSSETLHRLYIDADERTSLTWLSRVISDKWCNSLRALTLTGHISRDTDGEGLFVALSPLLLCRQLWSLSFKCDGASLLLDSHYDAMTLAWSELQELILFDTATRPACRASCRTLVRFASRCRDLRYLRIGLNFDLVDPTSLKPWTVTSQVQYLDHDVYSVCSQPIIVSSFLRHMFPALIGFSTFPGLFSDELHPGMLRLQNILQLGHCPVPWADSPALIGVYGDR